MNFGRHRAAGSPWHDLASYGAVILAGFLSSAASANPAPPGEAHYKRVCADCHEKGAKNKLSKGSPKLGDQKAWDSRIGKGFDNLYKKVIEAKLHGKADDAAWERTNPFIWRDDLTDAQIREALEYMFKRADE